MSTFTNEEYANKVWAMVKEGRMCPEWLAGALTRWCIEQEVDMYGFCSKHLDELDARMGGAFAFVLETDDDDEPEQLEMRLGSSNTFSYPLRRTT